LLVDDKRGCLDTSGGIQDSGQVLSSLNATFLTLIPKEERVSQPKQFRPIALCNVVYKIITKVIALRLNPILPFIISKEKSGYVEGCQIMDNIILVHEVIHSLKSTRTPGMLIKLDLSKAFDHLSWKYMQSLLLDFGFSNDWIHWILNLTSSSFFSILVNGVPSKPFSPSRGIRQGDPLSPFLFIIMAEGLGHYITASIADGSLQGLPLHGLQPTASHSQFVDDTMLMGTPTAQEAIKLKSILSYLVKLLALPLTWINLISSSLILLLLSNDTFLIYWAYPGAPFHPTILAFLYLIQQPEISLGIPSSNPFPID
jgi:hypothetical protein